MRLIPPIALLFALSPLPLSVAESNAPVHKFAFKNGASSTGWIDFEFQEGKRIFVPAKINGRDTMVLLATGLPISNIDKTFASSMDLQPEPLPNGPRDGAADDVAGLVRNLHIQIGNVTLDNSTASVVDFGPLAKHIGHPLPFLLGDDVFNGLAVDIDFAHHRIAFRAPATQGQPEGFVEVPLIRVEDLPLVPVSLEGAPPAQFELGLGNSGEMLVYQPYFESHKLLEGRHFSKRLAAGTGGFNPEDVATLGQAEFAGVTFVNIPAAFVPSSLAGTKSNVIAGDIGLPVLSRFRLIIDYYHGRLYALPYADAVRAPFTKDRLGLALTKHDAGFTVEFVAPNSPAQAAGFNVGDKIALVDGKPAKEWPEILIANLRYGVVGTNVVFTMKDGAVRQVKLADYF